MHTIVSMNEKTSYALSVTRVFATLCIFLCHAVQLSGSALLQKSGQILNVGVPMFMMLSGFLFALKPAPASYRIWFKNRIIRILAPYYLFLFLLLLVHVICAGIDSISQVQWFLYVVPLQGFTQDYINGAEHLWFVTDILLCYLLTPLLYSLQRKLENRKKRWLLLVIVLYFTVLLSSVFCLPAIVSTTIVTVFSYMIGFLFMKPLLSLRCYVFVITMFTAVALRVSANLVIDGTLLYDRLIAPVSHQLLGLSIFCLLFLLTCKYHELLFRVKRIVLSVDCVSYEIYLVHYMFITGPLTIRFFPVGGLNILLLLLVTAGVAVALHVFSDKLVKRLRGRKSGSFYDRNFK